MRLIIYLLIASGFLGSAFLSIELVKGLCLFPYRIILMLVIYLFFIAFFLKNGILNLSDIKITRYMQFFLLWFLYAIFSLSWAVDNIATVNDIIFLFINISTIFFIVYYFQNLKDLERYYGLWIFVLLILMGLGLWNQITGQQLLDYSNLDVPYYYEELFNHTPRATFCNQNDYATYLSLSIPFVITFIRYTKSIIVRLLGMIMLLLCLYLIVFTFSRANYIAVLLGFIFWFLFLLRDITCKIKTIVFILIVIGILSFIVPTSFNSIKELIDYQMEYSDDDGSLNTRLNLIKNSLFFLLNSFGIGIGAGNSEYYMEHYSIYYTDGIINVHNWWIEILVEYGVIFFMAYLIFYFNLFTNLYRIHKWSKNITEKKICESLLVGLVIFLLASISSSSIMNFTSQWLMFSFCLAFLNYYRISNRVSGEKHS